MPHFDAINIAWKLLSESKANEALLIFRRFRETNVESNNWRLAGGEGTAHLCLQQYANAVTAFQTANILATEEEAERFVRIGKNPALASKEPFLNKLGASEWLSGKRDSAVHSWRRSAQGVLDKTIEYGDFAGGVEQGLLLFYAGVSLGDIQIVSEAIKYLKNRASRDRIKSWPRPLACVILGKLEPGNLLRQEFGTENLEQAVAGSKVNVLMRRHLSQYLFFEAIRLRAGGETGKCDAMLRICANLQNPVLEIPWYLAQAEVEAIPVS